MKQKRPTEGQIRALISSVIDNGHPLLIAQRSVIGISLEPVNFSVIAWVAWVDMDMPRLYGHTYYPSVGLS